MSHHFNKAAGFRKTSSRSMCSRSCAGSVSKKAEDEKAEDEKAEDEKDNSLSGTKLLFQTSPHATKSTNEVAREYVALTKHRHRSGGGQEAHRIRHRYAARRYMNGWLQSLLSSPAVTQSLIGPARAIMGSEQHLFYQKLNTRRKESALSSLSLLSEGDVGTSRMAVARVWQATYHTSEELLMISPPHSTRSLLPLDVVLFAPLSRCCTEELIHYL
ncbi:hypothetical protein IG631_24045 [Alternaria alternata]|nr:hypothetical protein IG631_24045 [Alternaria alternata]